MGQTLATKLRAVGYDYHLVGGSHHRLLGFDQQQVVVEKAPFVDARYTEDRAAHVESLEHLIGVGTECYARARIDVSADNYQVVIGVRCEQVGNRERVSDNLQSTAHQQSGHFVRRATTIEQ